MALVIEDGSGVDGATSYATLDEIRAYATSRGVTTIPVADAALEALVIKGMDYLEAEENKFRGSRVSEDQALAWPRTSKDLTALSITSTTVPNELKRALSQLCVEQSDGVAISTTVTERFKIREKTGPLEDEYSDRIGTQRQHRPKMPIVEGHLRRLIKGFNGFRTVRV